MNKPIIGITMGDPASIGPEIAVKALMQESIHAICRPVIIGDANVFAQIVSLLHLPVTVNRITNISEANFQLGQIDVFDLQNVDMETLAFGTISAMSGEASFQAVKKVIELAMDKQIDATVTGPINKKSINEAGHAFAGHTEIYAKSINKFMVRHFVKPGITGLAQVSGFRGEIETEKDIIGRVKHDIFYIENWSFFLDTKIIVQTILNFLKGEEKAY